MSHGQPCSRRARSVSFTTGLRPSLGSTHHRHTVVFVVLLLMPTVGLDDVARDQLHRHITRVKMHHTFKDAHVRVIKRVVVRGLIIALLTNTMNLFVDVIVTCLNASVLFTRPCDTALGTPAISSDVLLRPSAFLCTLLFYFILGLLDDNVPT